MCTCVRLSILGIVVTLLVVLLGCHGAERESAAPGIVPGASIDVAQAELRGDLNGSGLPDVADAIAILRIVVGLDPFNSLADCDGDDNVGVADAIMLLRCVVGLDDWPIGGGAATIGPDGGSVTTVDGSVRLDVPSSALATEVDITISPQPDCPTSAGTVSGTCYEFGPDGTEFSQPAQLTIAYDETNIPAGKTESDLAVHKVVEGGWEAITGGAVDIDDNIVSAPVAGFSAYAILAGGCTATFDETIGLDGQTLVWVPEGSFTMGCDTYWSTQPEHTVTLDGFWIGRCEVTNQQYADFLNVVQPAYEENHLWLYNETATGVGWSTQWNADENRYDPVYPVWVAEGYEQYPMLQVTWAGAAAYCAHYGYALPTEAQWEYAARGPDGRMWPWGNLWDAAKCCNINNKGPNGKTFIVGCFPAGASWCGVLDMAGNIQEWCADWYDEDYYEVSPELNPTGPDSGTSRVERGGFWNCGSNDCNSVLRGGGHLPGGFRCAQPG